MHHLIDMLKAAAQRRGSRGASLRLTDDDAEPLDNVQAEAEHSRSALTMTRGAVQSDLDGMMRYFAVKPDQLPLYRDGLIEAEDFCARCKHVARCRRWRALKCHGDAPRLFCANVSLFEELTSDPCWTSEAPGPWHADTASSPLLRLLAKTSSGRSHDRPDLRTSKLRVTARAAIDIDKIIDEWTAAIEAPRSEQDAKRLLDQLDVAIQAAIDNIDGLSVAEFRSILQIALFDPELAERLFHLVEQPSPPI